MFEISKIQVKNIHTSAKSEYHNKKIEVSKGNLMTVSNVVNEVLHKITVLPNIINSDKDMAYCLITSSVKKILKIHDGFLFSILSQGKPLVEESSVSMMDTLEPFAEIDRQLQERSSNACCAVYPMTTRHMKECLYVLISPNYKYS